QQHMFSINEMPDVVEEYKGNINNFEWSNYSEQEQVRLEAYQALALDYHEKARSKVPAVIALYDNEAMTQDVGNIASQHIHEIADARQRVQSGEGGDLPDTALLDTGDIATASAALYRKKMVYENLKQTLQGTYNDDADLTERRYRSIAEREMLPDEQYNEQADEIMEHVDRRALNSFYADWQDLEEKVAALKPKARDALADHACWLKTAEAGNESTPTALGATLATYDKTNAHSALWFEMTTALCIDGMGAVIPNDIDHKDERDKLLDGWMDDPNSLIYQSIAPFDPFKEEFSVFKDKLDSAGDIL
ncbi:hypothetical protein, partial [Kangiella shandongensis]|uniref:hypothetical protein n=1 Tax=Kangiella shandongensis TaxID=2763258 RepID=UPI001CC14FA4